MLQAANKPEAHVTSYKVYVTGLKEDTDEADLREYFSQFGAVESVDVVVDRATHRSRGFAFVSFNDYDPVDKIVCKFCCGALHSPCNMISSLADCLLSITDVTIMMAALS